MPYALVVDNKIVQIQPNMAAGFVEVPAGVMVGWLKIASGFEAPPILPPLPNETIDQDTLNAALTEEGSVVRALALVLLQEINTVRTKLVPPLPAYTQAQLVAALKARMR